MTDEMAEAVSTLASTYYADQRRYTRIREHLDGNRNEIYVPQKATAEYRRLVEQSSFNVLPFVARNLVQALYLDGFRPSYETPEIEPDEDEAPEEPAEASREEAEPKFTFMDAWQDNRMDRRQSPWYRSTIQYGVSYVIALPGHVYGPDDRQGRRELPVVFTPRSPRDLVALYEDTVADEWPLWAMDVKKRGEGWIIADVYDETQVHPVKITGQPDSGTYTFESLVTKLADGSEVVAEPFDHGGNGIIPIVRSFDADEDLDDVPVGKIDPLISLQNQLNQTTFNLLMAQQYSAFRQRWVTGMEIEEDANGNPKAPFNIAVDKMLQAESPDARFGDFAQTDLGGYLTSRDKAQLFISAVGQVPPHSMVVGAGISNISAEALAALAQSHAQDVASHKTAFGESIEQLARLTGRLIGDDEMWNDRRAQVVWRDMTARSLAQIMDAWGKAVTMMEVPPEFAWSKIPDVTDLDIERIKRMQRRRIDSSKVDQALDEFGREIAAAGAQQDATGSIDDAIAASANADRAV